MILTDICEVCRVHVSLIKPFEHLGNVSRVPTITELPAALGEEVQGHFLPPLKSLLSGVMMV